MLDVVVKAATTYKTTMNGAPYTQKTVTELTKLATP